MSKVMCQVYKIRLKVSILCFVPA